MSATAAGRNWKDRAAEAAGLNALLRQPGGTQELFDIQAVSLLELWEHPLNGLFMAARVGSGKTHCLALAPELLRAKGFTRPQILAPASLLSTPGKSEGKTQREMRELRAHWKVVNQYWLDSYSTFSSVKNEGLIDQRQPDVLVFEEPLAKGGVRLLTGATAKRIGRYIHARRSASLPLAIIFLTGTPERDSMNDFAHMFHWAFGEHSPLPSDPIECAQWAAWLYDEDPSGQTAFAKRFGWDVARDIEKSWDAFRALVTGTPGIIVSDDAFDGAELEINVYRVDPGLDREFSMLRDLWQRPDGWQLLDASEADANSPDEVNTWSIWGIARQLALGFFYVADPPAPAEWLAARKAYADFVRTQIDAPESRYDTEKAVRNACERAIAGGRRMPEWERWREVKDTFRPSSRPVWLSTHALDAARSWGRMAPGIVWVDHLAFGERLAAETGWTFYGQMGLDVTGRSIEDADGRSTIIASRLANQQGRNLQRFNRHLAMAMMNAALDFEQWAGRSHRYGQLAPKVVLDIYACCLEHERGVEKCLRGANGTTRRWGMSQKILLAEAADACRFHGEVPASRAWR